VPNVAGVASSNHDSSVSVTKTVLSAVSGPLVGLAEPAPASKEVTVTFTLPSDLGEYGSFSLLAEAKNLPANVSGAYPVLVYLSDGTNEYVNIARGGGACGTGGYFSCPGGSCVSNSSCSISWPSAFNDRTHWQQHQIATFGYKSVNTFPTCFEDDTAFDGTTSNQPTCAFNKYFFTGAPARLRYNVTYTAKYVMLAEFVTLSGFGYTGDLEVTVVKKTDTTAGGAMDLNVILVGDKNVQASRTDAGKRNLDTLFDYVQTYYSQANVGVSLGTINAVEWPCASGGDAYANVSVDDLGTLFGLTSSLAPASSEGKAINLFLVSTIPDGTASNLTILGLAGGIGGDPLNGAQGSGLAFSSLNKLDTYNPSCTTSPCPATQQQSAFADMGSTIAHEIGHYLGLNHPTESSGATHDVVFDTPRCTVTASIGGTQYITNSSCRSTSNAAFYPTGNKCSDVCAGYSSSTPVFCAAAVECQFNHVMWWTSKNFNTTTGTGDGNIFSEDSGRVMNYNSFIR
jgi:hypothetical protein